MYKILISVLFFMNFHVFGFSQPDIVFTASQIHPDIIDNYKAIYGKHITIISLEVDFINNSDSTIILNMLDQKENNKQYTLTNANKKVCNINWGRDPALLYPQEHIITLDTKEKYTDTLFFSYCDTSKIETKIILDFTGEIVKNGKHEVINLSTISIIKF